MVFGNQEIGNVITYHGLKIALVLSLCNVMMLIFSKPSYISFIVGCINFHLIFWCLMTSKFWRCMRWWIWPNVCIQNPSIIFRIITNKYFEIYAFQIFHLRNKVHSLECTFVKTPYRKTIFILSVTKKSHFVQ